MKQRYKNKQKQRLYEGALKLTYPVTFDKYRIGGSSAFAWNLGYEGKVKKTSESCKAIRCVGTILCRKGS